MNPKQLACVVLMMFIGCVTYFGQIVHKKVGAMKKSADMAAQDAFSAEGARQTAEILTARTKAETEEVRRFLQAWSPHVDKAQTEQEVESTIEFSLRERGISLVRSRKTEVKTSRDNKVIPKTVLTTVVIEDEFAKVLNWLGDVEKRLPLARVKTCRITGGSTARQLRLDVSFETPLINLASDPSASEKTKKKA
ncbi:hypothetical protein GCM10023213_04770 [Prosthecobacter algae]|uniref:Type II secretion system (T2SS) protein M subtype b n=1 Tax=Prosthecobacter algae TaxID=1144682 RepID=A0ABP9NTU4_9BACT